MKSEWLFTPLMLVICGAVGVLFFFLMSGAFVHGVSLARQQHACDVIVERFMSTDDVAEVQRDAHLIDWMDCRVTRRVVPKLVP